jgi:endonuclease YncB( thermonuclease family)
MCAGKAANVDDRGSDRYDRTLGRVIFAGVDANAEQLRRSMAWVYGRYAQKDSRLYGQAALYIASATTRESGIFWLV